MPRRKLLFDAQSEFLHADKQLEEEHQVFLNQQIIIDKTKEMSFEELECVVALLKQRHYYKLWLCLTPVPKFFRTTAIVPVMLQNLALIQHSCKWREDYPPPPPAVEVCVHCVDLHTKQTKELNINIRRGGEQITSTYICEDLTERVQSFLCLHMLTDLSGTVIITALVNKTQLNFLKSFSTSLEVQLPGRFVSEDSGEDHTDDLEAVFWALTFSLKFNLVDPVRTHNDRFIINGLQLKWRGNNYIWEKFESFTSEDDVNDVFKNKLQFSEYLNIHYTSIGDKDPKHRKKAQKVKSAYVMKDSNMNRRNLQKKLITSWPENPARVVCEDFRKHHTDDIEALAWSIFYCYKDGKVSRVKYKDIQRPGFCNNDRFIIYDLQLKWGGNDYNWEKFKLFTPEDINNVVENCYMLKSSENILNEIVHQACVGEKDPIHIMINSWIYKLYPQKLYVFLVGKQLIKTEKADEIRSIIEGQYKKHRYKDIREGIKSCKENKQDLNDLYSEYAQYTKETLQGVYTHGRLDPCKEAWFTTYFTATVISESIRNFRSFVITIMILVLSLSQNPALLVEEHPMARGGSWPNSDKRGFYGASSPVGNKNKDKNLKKLIENEDEICNTWLLGKNKSEIDREMIKCLLELIYGEHRLRTDPSLLETTITKYLHFKQKINSFISPEWSHCKPISLQNIKVNFCLLSLISPTTTNPTLITHYPHLRLRSSAVSVVYNYSSENIQNLNSSVQASNISINPDVLSSVNMWLLFHQHFSRESVDSSLVLWKKISTLHFTNLLKTETFICLHLNPFFSECIPKKGLVNRDSVKQQHFIFLFLPSESLLDRLWKSPRRFRGFISNAAHIQFNSILFV